MPGAISWLAVQMDELHQRLLEVTVCLVQQIVLLSIR